MIKDEVDFHLRNRTFNLKIFRKMMVIFGVPLLYNFSFIFVQIDFESKKIRWRWRARSESTMFQNTWEKFGNNFSWDEIEKILVGRSFFSFTLSTQNCSHKKCFYSLVRVNSIYSQISIVFSQFSLLRKNTWTFNSSETMIGIISSSQTWNSHTLEFWNEKISASDISFETSFYPEFNIYFRLIYWSSYYKVQYRF